MVVPAAEPVLPAAEEATLAEELEQEAALAEETALEEVLEAEQITATAAELEAAAPEGAAAAAATAGTEVGVAPAATAGAEAAAPPAEEALGEDLKSRIEETRRRIREELERPFAVVDQEESPGVSGDLTVGVAPSPATEAVPPEPVVVPSPVIGEPIYVNVGATDAVAEPEAVAAVAPSGNGSDYDAMRARIELTRSRLKAKAFDAMMAGESALLRRDPEGSPAPQKSVSVDSEIEQTVESTLREEDD
jgi:hypothetical protein